MDFLRSGIERIWLVNPWIYLAWINFPAENLSFVITMDYVFLSFFIYFNLKFIAQFVQVLLLNCSAPQISIIIFNLFLFSFFSFLITISGYNTTWNQNANFVSLCFNFWCRTWKWLPWLQFFSQMWCMHCKIILFSCIFIVHVESTNCSYWFKPFKLDQVE